MKRFDPFDGYTINVFLDDDGEYLAHFVELPNVSAFGGIAGRRSARTTDRLGRREGKLPKARGTRSCCTGKEEIQRTIQCTN